jgi:RHS repeat-associated protein
MKKLCFTTGPLLAILVFVGTVMPLRADNPAVPCECKSLFDTEGATLCNVTFANNASPSADQLATVYKVRAQEADGSPGQALELKKQANGQYKIQLHMDYIQNNNCSGTSGAKLHWKVEFTDQSAARTGIFPVLNPSGGIYELELDGKDSYSSFSVSYLGNGQTQTIPCVSFKIKSSCACSSCEITGQPVSNNSAERCHIALGVFQDATLSGGLVIDIPSLANSTASRSVVKVLSGAGITVTADSGGLLTATTDSLRAVLTKDDEEGTVTITLLNPSGNTIRTILVEWPGQNELKITNTFAGSPSTPEVTEFKITNNELEMIRGNGMLKETKTITTLNGDRVERIKVVEILNTNEKLVSDIENTFHHFIWGWEMVKQVIDPNTEKLTTTWTYVTAQGVGQGSILEMTRYDAYKETHSYFQSTAGTVVTTTHSIKSPFADENQKRVSTRNVDSANATQNVTDEVFDFSNDTSIFSKKVTEDAPNSRIEKIYSDRARYTKTETLYNATNGRPEQVTHPDGTLTTYSYTTSGGNPATVTRRGARGTAGNINNVIEGTETTTVTSPRGFMISSVTTAIGTQQGMEIDRQEVTSDLYGRPTLIGYFGSSGNPAWTTSKTYQGCCGAELTETDKYGIVTTYGAPDALGRPTSTVRLGVTTSTEYDGLTTITKRNGDIIAKTIRNLAGTIHAEWGPSPQTGALVELSTTTTHYRNPNVTPNPNPHNLPAKIGTRTIREVILVADDNSVIPKQTEDSYFDGKLYESTGDLAPDTRNAYAMTNDGIITSRFFLDGANLLEPTYTISNRAGNTVGQFHGTMGTSYAYYVDGAATQITGQLFSTKDADGVKTLYAYNSLGERTTTAIKRNNTNDSITYGTDTVQRSETKPAARTDGTKVIRTKTYVWKDANTDPEAGTWVATTERTPDGLKTWSSALGVTGEASTTVSLGGGGDWSETTIKHDQSKSVTTYTDGLWDNTEEKNSANATVSWTSAQKVDNTRGYDGFNRPTHIKDSRTGVTVTEYLSDTCDTVVSVQPPAGASQKTTFSYDHRGRRIQVDAPQSVDANNVTLDNITYTEYWPDGSVKQVSGGQTYPVSYTYDYAGRKLTMTTNSAAGNATTKWIYSTTTGQLTDKKYNYIDENTPGSGPSYTYTNAGRPLTRSWVREVSQGVRVKATYGYTYGLLTSVTYNDNITPGITYNYDAYSMDNNHVPGDLETVTRGGQTWVYTYDSNTLRPLTETQPLGGTAINRILTRSFDLHGRPDGFQLGTSTDADIDHSAAYEFDNAGRYNKVTAAGKVFDYTYITSSQRLIHTVAGPAGMLVENTWQGARDVLAVKNNMVASSTISQYTYGVNNLGQRDGVTTAGSAFGNANRGWTWGYDALGQATKAVNAANTDFNRAFVYDNIGNRTSATDGSGGNATTVGYTPNALNQYTTINPGTAVNPDFDADGNLKADAGINGMGYGLKYEWDAENRITVVRKADTTLLATYVYDHIGRRIRKTTTAAAFQGVSDTAYFYDGFNVVAEYTLTNSGSSAALQQAYTWGLDLSGSMQGAGGVGGMLCIHRVPGTDGSGNRTWTDTFYPTYDGNGNVSEYLDKNGAEVAHFEYDPFGRVVHSTGTPALFTYRFSTKPLDFETGLYYYLYRYYDPLTGRWPSRDPIEERGGVNLYGFLGNDGVNLIDKFGMISHKHPADVPKFEEEGEECNLPSAEFIELKLSGSFDVQSWTSGGTPHQSLPVTFWFDYKIKGFYLGPHWAWETCLRDPTVQPHTDPNGEGDIPWGHNVSPLKFLAVRQQLVELHFHYLSCECDGENLYNFSGRRIWKLKGAIAGLMVTADADKDENFVWSMTKPNVTLKQWRNTPKRGWIWR